MWKRSDLEDPGRALAELSPGLDALAADWRDRWNAIDDAAEARRVHEELRTSAAAWGRALAKTPGVKLAGVRFYFAGTEVAPYVPQMVWADGLAEVRRDGGRLRPGARLFGEKPAFELGVVGALLAALGEDEALMESAEGEALAKALVLRCLGWLQTALHGLRSDAAFAALPVTEDFVFLVTPGHDEPWGVVGQGAEV